MAKNQGGLAFPGVERPIGMGNVPGMTMRQYYKCQAIAVSTDSFEFCKTTPEEIAKNAGLIADAMIAEDEVAAK
jgi:hypothetical protein